MPFKRINLSLTLFVFSILLCGSALAVIVPIKYRVTDTLKLPGSTRWDYLTFDADTHRLFVTRGDHMDVLDVGSRKIVGTLSDLHGVHGVALATDLGKGFVSEGETNQVTVFELSTLRRLATIRTDVKPDAILYDKEHSRIFVANGESSDITVIDAKANWGLGTIKLAGKPEFMALNDQGELFVNLEDKGRIAVIDTEGMTVKHEFDLSSQCVGPTGLAVDKARNRLFSTCSSKQMIIIDALDGKIVSTLPIGQHSDAAVYDSERNLAFSSNGDGTLTVIGFDSDEHYKVVQTLATKVTARTMALDPKSHMIYLAAADTDGFDPPTEKHPEPRPHIKANTFVILTVADPE